MNTAADPRIVLRQPPPSPALRAADRGVAAALTAVLSDNTRRVYGAQWRLYVDWRGDVGLRALPAEPLTVARYLAVRAALPTEPLTVARYLAVRAARPPSPSSKSTSGRAPTLLQRSRCKRVCDKFGEDRQDRRNIQ